MKILNILASKYAVFCPKCEKELNLFTYGTKGLDILKCLQCNVYYKKINNKSLELTTPPVLPFLESDRAYLNYEGFPSSYAYSPNWLTGLRQKYCFKSIGR